MQSLQLSNEWEDDTEGDLCLYFINKQLLNNLLLLYLADLIECCIRVFYNFPTHYPSNVILIQALLISLLAGSTDAEVMTVAEFVQKQASNPGGCHIAMIYAFLTTLDIDSNIKRVTAHRWYDYF